MTEEELDEIRKELEQMKVKFGLKEPERSFMDDPLTIWMFDGVPDYSLTNYFFLKERTKRHAEGSLEIVVENLVKTWEMERSHKPDCLQHQTTDPVRFRFSANGGEVFDNVGAHQEGNYNVLLNTCPKEYYDASKTSWMQSHNMFHAAFPAFPWELLEVFSPPPKVAFSWRHWAHFTGYYGENKGEGQIVELYGFATATVNEKLQICDLEVYFNPVEFFQVLKGEKMPSETNRPWKDGLTHMESLKAAGGGCLFASASKRKSNK